MANSNITISFSTSVSGKDKFITLDLDEELNKEETTFLFGDDAYFRIFSNCEDILVFPSDGTIKDNGIKTAEVEEIITFTQPPESAGGKAKDNTASLQFPPNDTPAPAFELISNSTCGTLSLDEVDTRVVKASLAGVAVYRAKYEADYLSKSVSVTTPTDWPADEEYPVVIVVTGS